MTDVTPTDVATQIARIEAEERELVLVRFDNTDAWRLGSILVSLAKERSLAVTIDIVRGEQQLFHAAMPGTAAHNDVWISRKVATVREFNASSLKVGIRFPVVDAHELELAPWMDPRAYTGSGGGFPITIRDVGVVGVVSVSGLPHEDDHALLVEGLRAFIAEASA